jgi:hypothetical protein
VRARRAALTGVAVAVTSLVGCAPTPDAAAVAWAEGPACGAEHTSATTVATSSQLAAALGAVGPGRAIVLKAGVYAGHFTGMAVGTQAAPVRLCGGRDAILDGGDTGYVLHLQGAAWWEVSGVSMRGGEKGVVLDGTTHTQLVDLHVSGTGMEAVHLRASSSHDVVRGLRIDHTGLSAAKFGEGVYVGSAKGNWCEHASCGPDESNDNTVQDVTFGAGITAENVDIKEGTTGGLVVGNRFDGSGATAVDSWVDVKGNEWTVRDNVGTSTPRDGAQVHVQLPGWGERNRFSGNRFTLSAPGVAIRLASASGGNIVSCSNQVIGTGAVSNVACR